MIKYLIYFLTSCTILPIVGCQKTPNNTQEIDNNSYINNFELLQKNSSNLNTIKITSPKAIIDPITNDIEIFDSSIEIINDKGKGLEVISGNSILNNSQNSIKVFNNVKISLHQTKNYFIRTNSFLWDLNTSIIDLNSPLDINFNNTMINSKSGLYNIKLNFLKINDNLLNRNIYNNDGKEKYQIQITSDLAKWYSKNNTLEFKSKKKQVETTINFLSIK